MNPFNLARFTRRHIAWLMWLAMLVPAAQMAATLHELSHLDAAAAHGVDKAAHHKVCELCLAGDAIAGGALVIQPFVVAHAPIIHGAPVSPVRSVWAGAAARAYESRAPPFNS
jgi:hypothetical protein